MQKYLAQIKGLIALFKSFKVERLVRSQNKQADTLFKWGSASQHDIKGSVLVEVKPQSAIHEDATLIFVIHSQNLPSWLEEMIRYKEENVLPLYPIREKKSET